MPTKTQPTTPFTAFPETIQNAQASLATLAHAINELTTMRDAAAAEIAKHLRVDSSVRINVEAIRATITRPYTLLPINEREAWIIHWRGIEMPVFGWVVAQEEAFIKAKVTRSMDLLTPLPGWMRQELGWKPPEHQAIVDSSRTGVRVTQGDEASFKRRYGSFLGARQEDGSFKIRGGDAWIRLVSALLNDGILPYAPQPVAEEHWHPDDVARYMPPGEGPFGSSVTLRDYQEPAVAEFRAKGAVFVNFPPGAGKTYISAYILQHFVGRVLVLADTSLLVEYWIDCVKEFAPAAHVTVGTYQGAARYLNQEWDLVIFDEAQRLPANTFSKLAFMKTKYRLGLSATAWREDRRENFIAALSGFPVHVPWAQLIRAGVLKRPRIIVATVPTETAKTQHVKQLVAQESGRVLIFCDWLEQGQALADALDVPFVSGSSTRKLQQIEESRVCVVSRIGDRGLDLPDLRLVIEVAFHGKAREQFAQRVGRLLHGEFHGRFITVFTPAEAAQYRPRIFGVEAELAGEVDIEFLNVGDVTDTAAAAAKLIRPRVVSRQALRAQARSRVEPKADKPQDEISEAMALPSVAAKLAKAKSLVGERTAPYVDRAFRLCYEAPMSAEDIAEGMGLKDVATISRFRSASSALVKVGLFNKVDGKRHAVNREEINRLRALARAIKKG